ncbi:MAG: FkbM family methyltransferase [Lachnospiraceae bacterium]|nr:FkbM family methyltransferase [Lachnospiraceae bacterium]
MRMLEKSTLDELSRIVDDLELLMHNIGDAGLSPDIADVIKVAMMQVNDGLYASPDINLAAVDVEFDIENVARDAMAVLKAMIPVWRLSFKRRSGLNVDSRFWSIYEYFKYIYRDRIIANSIKWFNTYSEEYRRQYMSLPMRYTFLTGRLDVDANDYSLIEIYTDMMQSEIEEYKWFYEKLSDYKSKELLVGIIRYMFTFNLESLSGITENIFEDYYDLDLVPPGSCKVFVDCGAFIGDSVLSFIKEYGRDSYSKIYAYEIDPKNVESFKHNLEGFSNIEIREKGVGKEKGELFLNITADGEGSRLAEAGENRVTVVSLDDDIEEPIDVIKMDIEGAETDALMGAIKHIKEEKPKLLICTYHKPADIFEIPKLIESMRSDYKFYLRYNGRGIWPCDYVLFAV